MIWLINAVLIFLYMSLWFAVAYHRKRLDTVDIAWGPGFVVVGWASYLQQPSTVSLILAILVSIWGLRLAYHIWQRSKRHDVDDRRYQEIHDKWSGNTWLRAYVSIFLLQGGLILIVSLPIVLATGIKLAGNEWLVLLGIIIWLKGFAWEVIADGQLRAYLQLKQRPKVLDTGLWKYSRHPNYFGELLMWWGIGCIGLQASYGWIGLAGPLLLSILIIFVSGIPPIEKRRAKDAAYREYMRRTSPLIPLPPRA